MNILLKAKYSFISALVFFLVSNPEFYKATQQLMGEPDTGCATPWGHLLHTGIFFLAMLGLMTIPQL